MPACGNPRNKQKKTSQCKSREGWRTWGLNVLQQAASAEESSDLGSLPKTKRRPSPGVLLLSTNTETERTTRPADMLNGIPHLERPDGECGVEAIDEHVLQLPVKVARVAGERVSPAGRASQLRPAPNNDACAGLESSACGFPASTSPRDFLAWETAKFQKQIHLCNMSPNSESDK